MKTIHKFVLAVIDTQPIGLPLGAKPLALQMQHGRPTLWALLDDEAEKQNLVVYCCGTGNPVLGNVGAYLGTVQDGHFVWHYFLQSRAT